LPINELAENEEPEVFAGNSNTGECPTEPNPENMDYSYNDQTYTCGISLSEAQTLQEAAETTLSLMDATTEMMKSTNPGYALEHFYTDLDAILKT
jgi:hypothetical protein